MNPAWLSLGRPPRLAASIAVALGVAWCCAPRSGDAPSAAPPEASLPKYGPRATRLYEDRAFVRVNEAPDFWALLPYYLPQRTDSSCSVASVAMLVNALRAGRRLGADEPLVTEAGLLGALGDREWERATAEGGEGVDLEQLGALIERVLSAYGLEPYRVDVVHVDSTSEETRARLRAVLSRNERSGEDFVLVNFLQSTLTGDPDGAVGHIAPIAAYDASRDRALVLDPDRRWYEPYWVPLDALLEAMATRDPTVASAEVGGRGWRGFVHVRTRGALAAAAARHPFARASGIPGPGRTPRGR